jgi:hypothetical protein
MASPHVHSDEAKRPHDGRDYRMEWIDFKIRELRQSRGGILVHEAGSAPLGVRTRSHPLAATGFEPMTPKGAIKSLAT